MNCDTINSFLRCLINNIKAERGQLTEGDELETVGGSVSNFTLNKESTTRCFEVSRTSGLPRSAPVVYDIMGDVRYNMALIQVSASGRGKK